MFTVVAFVTSMASQASAQWNYWSQNQKNAAILNRAFAQNGMYTGLQCKHWVQNVVYSASGGVVWLPLNHPNLYQWEYHPRVFKLQPFHPSWCQPGQIIQMKWNNTPHTAIVVSTSHDRMRWIDCNWGLPTNNTMVSVHDVTYHAFAGAVGSNYSVYEVR